MGASGPSGVLKYVLQILFCVQATVLAVSFRLFWPLKPACVFRSKRGSDAHSAEVEVRKLGCGRRHSALLTTDARVFVSGESARACS